MVRRLEHREPASGRVMRHARIRPQLGQVELGCGTPRDQSHEGGERRKLPDIEYLSDVTLNIGAHIVGVPARRWDLPGLAIVAGSFRDPAAQALSLASGLDNENAIRRAALMSNEREWA